MKAAIIYQQGELPQFVEIPQPAVQNDDEILVTVKAVALKHFDKGRAAGIHYSSAKKTEAKIPGGDGICLLPDGTRVYGIGVSGMLAEKAIIHKNRMVKIPDNLDDISAAALPNAVIGAAMALKFKAGIQPGDVVLVNGATGFTGRIAVQLAKYYGAKKVIVSGRDKDSLNELPALGADEIITINEQDMTFETQLKAMQLAEPVNIVIDYLWGHTAEIIFACLKGNGSFTSKISYVSVGSMAGDQIRLSAETLRSTDLHLTGSGLGAWSRREVNELITKILPEMFGLAAAGKLMVDTVAVNLKDIAMAWKQEAKGGQRIVVSI